ncbi:hypothetical protein NUM3379_38960 [Kineococcus sp. NUM-3379]
MDPKTVPSVGWTVPVEPALRCSVDMDTTRSTVCLTGELDAETAPLLEAVVEGQLQQGHVDIRLDVSGLIFCGVRGLDAMVAAQQRLRAAGGELTLLRPSPFLERVARLCGAGVLLGERA